MRTVDRPAAAADAAAVMPAGPPPITTTSYSPRSGVSLAGSCTPGIVVLSLEDLDDAAVPVHADEVTGLDHRGRILVKVGHAGHVRDHDGQGDLRVHDVEDHGHGGAQPSRRVMCSTPDQPDDPLAAGNTSTFPAIDWPTSSCSDSMMVPVRWSMPPQPATASVVTRASPSQTPPPSPRPCSWVAVMTALPASVR